MEPVEFRRRLHAHPELSFKEHATAAFIEQQLDELGIEHRRIASTGVVARIKGRKTPEGDRRAAVLRRLPVCRPLCRLRCFSMRPLYTGAAQKGSLRAWPPPPNGETI